MSNEILLPVKHLAKILLCLATMGTFQKPQRTWRLLIHRSIFFRYICEDFFIDFLVTAPNDTNAKEASRQVGHVDIMGEARKHNAVNSHYDVPPHRQHQIVLFVMETSGSMGTSASEFLDRIMAVYPKSSPCSEGLLIGRLKERMAVDVLKHNSYLVETS